MIVSFSLFFSSELMNLGVNEPVPAAPVKGQAVTSTADADLEARLDALRRN